MKRTNFMSLCLLGASCSLMWAGCDEGIRDAQRPVPTYVGQSACSPGEQFIGQIRNDGEGDLILEAPRVSGPAGLVEVIADGFPQTVGPGQTAFFDVACSGSGASGTATVTFGTNAGDTTIRVAVTPTFAQIAVSPNPIDFGRVPSGTERTLDIEVLNVGGANLDLSGILLIATTSEFEIPAGALDVLEETDEFGNRGYRLPPNSSESFTFPLTYRPSSDGYDSARLVVESNDPNSPRLNVPIEANGAAPCIRVNHEDGYNFGARLLNVAAEEVFTITNCSEGPTAEELIVENVVLTDSFPATRDAFAVTFQAAWGSPVDWPIILGPGETDTFIVSYTPTQLTDTDRAELQIVSNDDFKSPMNIELNGTGSNNQCPTAVASCRVRGGSGAPSNELAVLPLDTLDCTAAGSNDPDGTIVEYQWEVLLAPSGSTSRFQNANAEQSSFFVDIAGAYRMQLNLFDDAGAPACSPAIIEVLATPDQDIHVQLVWDTPGDTDRFDTGPGAGSDLDLHFLHPNGNWCHRTWDCHFRNRSPNWGSLDPTADDNPSLDIDRVDGWGPENVNMRNPENNVSYRVGVKYYNDHGYGYSDATVRIYLLGTLVWTQTRRLERTGYFWEAASISWPSMEVTSIDSVTPSVPRPNDCSVGRGGP